MTETRTRFDFHKAIVDSDRRAREEYFADLIARLGSDGPSPWPFTSAGAAVQFHMPRPRPQNISRELWQRNHDRKRQSALSDWNL